MKFNSVNSYNFLLDRQEVDPVAEVVLVIIAPVRTPDQDQAVSLLLLCNLILILFYTYNKCYLQVVLDLLVGHIRVNHAMGKAVPEPVIQSHRNNLYHAPNLAQLVVPDTMTKAKIK